MSRWIFSICVLLFSGSLLAQEPAKPAPSQEALIEKLEMELTGVKLVGKFTVTGKADMTPKEEEYTITSAMKLPEPDLWLLKARVKYGQSDGTFPIPLEIKWAGDTPVITLTNLAIPGLGTFSSRVVIYEGRYAGTWQHGDVGGHLFGVLQRPEEAKPPAEKAED
ncbi:MAG: hypothetical protein WD872_20855 [Pirellulaceae bacterium]